MARLNWIVRRVIETTPGTTPAGAMLAAPYSGFSFTGGGVPTRTQAANVTSTQEVPDNPATYFETNVTADTDALQAHHALELGMLMGQTSAGSGFTLTATTIAAVASGNKLTSTTGDWATLQAGDVVEYSGDVANPGPFLLLVVSAAGTDLVVDWKTLVNQSSGASATVKYVGKYRVTSGLVTASYELWNSTIVSGQGHVLPRCGVSEWTWGFDIPNPVKQAFKIVCGSKPLDITAQLANTTTAYGAQYPMNSNVHFGRKALPGYGGGFRIAEVLQPTIRISKINITGTRPVKTSGGAGTLGPMTAFTDGRCMFKVDFEVYREGAAAEALFVSAKDPDFAASFGWAMIDGNGVKSYMRFPRLQFEKGDPTGLATDGEDMFSFSMVASSANAGGSYQYTLLG